MIQDIYPYVYRNEYIDKQPCSDSFIFCFSGNELLMKAELTEAGGEEISYPHLSEADGWADAAKWQYLFAIEELVTESGAVRRMEFFLEMSGEKKEIPGYQYVGTELLRRSCPRYLAFAGVTAMQLSRWYRNTRFCGHCGKPLTHSDKERMMQCKDCGFMKYPDLCPAVIVAISDGDRLLLTKYAQGNYHRYALVAGYSEIGETIEETVRREVMEEVGLTLSELRYYKSQPWSISGTLLFGFWAKVQGSTEIRLDTNELSEAVWLTRDEILKEITPDEISLTREMMLRFAEGADK